MDAELAARRWAETWERAWPGKDIDAIAALYADGVNYRALVQRKAAGFCACPAHDIAYAAWFAGEVGYRIGGIRGPLRRGPRAAHL
jgi:ketosteroid isomerase-like protein